MRDLVSRSVIFLKALRGAAGVNLGEGKTCFMFNRWKKVRTYILDSGAIYHICSLLISMFVSYFLLIDRPHTSQTAKWQQCSCWYINFLFFLKGLIYVLDMKYERETNESMLFIQIDQLN